MGVPYIEAPLSSGFPGSDSTLLISKTKKGGCEYDDECSCSKDKTLRYNKSIIAVVDEDDQVLYNDQFIKVKALSPLVATGVLRFAYKIEIE